jgi:ribose transport system substrate-binding protein
MRFSRNIAAPMAVAAFALVAAGSASAATEHASTPSYLKTYETALTKAEAPVKWDGPTVPAKAPKNVTVGVVSCSYSVEGCKADGVASLQVAKALGWKTKQIIVDTPSGYGQAMQTLLNEGVQAINISGIEEQLVSTGIKAAAAKHIPVVSAGANYATGGPGEVNVDVHGNVNEEGQLMADAAMVDHAGNVDALFLQDAEFTEPVNVLKAVKAQFATCKQCKITYANPINFTATVISTTLPGSVVTAIQSNPAINSLIIGFDPPAPYIVPALDAAGDKTKVTMYTQLGDSAPLALVQQGNVLHYDVAESTGWSVWGDYDEIIRALDHKPYVNENLPLQVFTSSNPSAVAKLGGNDFAATFAGYQAKYEKLWGIK